MDLEVVDEIDNSMRSQALLRLQNISNERYSSLFDQFLHRKRYNKSIAQTSI